MTRHVVLDNSILCRYRFRETGWRNVAPLIRAIERGDVFAYAPPHLLLEFFQVARRKAEGRAVHTSRRLRRDHDWLTALPIQYIPTDYLEDARALRLVIAQGVGSYDAVYFLLAKRSRFPLASCDVALLGRAKTAKIPFLDLQNAPFAP